VVNVVKWNSMQLAMAGDLLQEARLKLNFFFITSTTAIKSMPAFIFQLITRSIDQHRIGYASKRNNSNNASSFSQVGHHVYDKQKLILEHEFIGNREQKLPKLPCIQVS